MNGYRLLKVRGLEGEEIVHREIPNGDDANCEYFGEVEVQFQFFVKKKDNKVVDSQPDDGNQEELSVFNGDVCVGALEGPKTIPEVVVGGGEGKTDGVGNVLVPAELLLAQPRGAEIDHHARKADHAKLQEFHYQNTVNHGFNFNGLLFADRLMRLSRHITIGAPGMYWTTVLQCRVPSAGMTMLESMGHFIEENLLLPCR